MPAVPEQVQTAPDIYYLTPVVGPVEPVEAASSDIKSKLDAKTEDDLVKNLLEGGDNLDFGKLLQELMQSQYQEGLKKEIEKRTQLLQALPEVLREKMSALTKSYQDFAQSLKLEKCLAGLCQKLRPAIDALTFENGTFKTELLANIDELYRALNDGSFARMTQPEKLPGNPLDLQNVFMQVLKQTMQAQQEEAHFDAKSLHVIVEQLTAFSVLLVHDEQYNNQQELRNTTETMLTLLSLVEQKDHKKLSHVCIDLIRADYVVLAQNIKDLIGLLSDAHIQCDQALEPLLKEALEYWIKQIKVYKQTLASFFALVSSTAFDVSLFLRLISNTYEIVSVVFEVNRFKFFGWANSADISLRSAIGLMAYFQRSNQEAAQLIQKYVLGDGDLTQFTNPLNQIEYKFMSALNIVPLVLFNPTNFAERLGWKKTMVLRVVGALIWYRVKRLNNPLENPNEWPNKDWLMRVVLSSLVKDAQAIAGSFLKNEIKEVVGAEVLEELENASMGLIKPELVDLAFDIAVPYFLTQKSALNDFVEFKPHDFLFDQLWFLNRLEAMNSNVQSTAAENIGKGAYDGGDKKNVLSFFIRYRALCYLFSNLGLFGGKKLARAFDGKIAQLAYAGFKNSVNFIDRVFVHGDEDDDDTVPTQFDSIESSLKEALTMVKILLITVLQEDSSERSAIIGFLKSRRWVDESVTDPLKINDSIVGEFLRLLEDHRIFSHQQAKELMEVYFEQRTQVGSFIDLLITRLKENLVAAAFGAVGYGVGTLVADYVAWNKMSIPRLA